VPGGQFVQHFSTDTALNPVLSWDNLVPEGYRARLKWLAYWSDDASTHAVEIAFVEQGSVATPAEAVIVDTTVRSYYENCQRWVPITNGRLWALRISTAHTGESALAFEWELVRMVRVDMGVLE
jgi:hypothetical protein